MLFKILLPVGVAVSALDYFTDVSDQDDGSSEYNEISNDEALLIVTVLLESSQVKNICSRAATGSTKLDTLVLKSN